MPSLTILTPDRLLLKVEDVTKVRLRLADEAWLSIYPHHAPLIAETHGGPVQYDTETESGELDVAAGILHVNFEDVIVMTSGLQRGRAQAPVSEADDDARFDRLAKQLMQTLNAQSDVSTRETSEDVS